MYETNQEEQNVVDVEMIFRRIVVCFFVFFILFTRVEIFLSAHVAASQMFLGTNVLR